ncbi:hypothetical protein AS589_15010 [Empedobacter brevis]|nr:hypothetical protein AS589_15010 [Empedobacter brevis]
MKNINKYTTAHCFKQWAVSLIDDTFTVSNNRLTLIVIFQHLYNITFTKQDFPFEFDKGYQSVISVLLQRPFADMQHFANLFA